MWKQIGRAIIEICFILFLFYANLLMGQYIRGGIGQINGLAWSIRNIFTVNNFIIGAVAAFIGYVVFEFLRKKF